MGQLGLIHDIFDTSRLLEWVAYGTYARTERLGQDDSSEQPRWPRKRARSPHARATLGRRAGGDPRPATQGSSTAPPARPVHTRPWPVCPPLGVTAPANESGSGGDAEAIADLLSIARLLPGHDPGAGYGVATAARQR